MLQTHWTVPTEFPSLQPDHVHVWLLDLQLSPDRIAELSSHLDPEELVRAGRYHFEKHRRRFIACRCQTREILARYLQSDPRQLTFDYGPQGKPALSAPWNSTQLEFNVSNSEELALIAVTWKRPLGVDLEYIKPPHDYDAIARQFFAPEEIAVLDTLTGDARLAGFFDCWTRKEAVLKAVGVGLSVPLNQVVVSVTPGAPAAVLKFQNQAGHQSAWWMQSLDPHSAYAAAIAAVGSPLQPQCWLWT
ncbi:MAG: 4'-phosphopantetheinyl transferase superfamily protein [Planctomycetes bacterium]|nr:4'-phosphopantetheinyl transferase superfamily protein [Planctomycetota bacterium]